MISIQDCVVDDRRQTDPRPDTTDQAQAVARREVLVASSGPRAFRTARAVQTREADFGYARTRASEINPVPRAACRTIRSTIAPELAKLLRQFLSGHIPVATNALAELGNVSLDFELVLFQPRHIELLSGGTAFELASNVLVIVTNNPDRCQSDIHEMPPMNTYFVIIPVVLTPSVRCVTRNLPWALIGA
jgi:hypothetical protein